MNTISVMLMGSPIIDKKSPRRGRRAEHQSTDSRRQTKRKHASRTLERLDLFSCYFLKRSKIDISCSAKFLSGSQRSLCSPRRSIGRPSQPSRRRQTKERFSRLFETIRNAYLVRHRSRSHFSESSFTGSPAELCLRWRDANEITPISGIVEGQRGNFYANRMASGSTAS
jgi:hypothetical protein